MKRKMTMLLTLSLSLLIAGAALAQPRGPRGDMTPEKIEKFKEKRAELLRSKVGLTEAEAIKVEAVMDRFHGERQELHEQVWGAKNTIRDLLAEDSEDQLAFKNQLDILLAARSSMQELHVSEITEMRSLLTPKKSAKLLAMMDRVHNRMRGKKMRGNGGGEGRDCPRDGRGDGPGGFSF